jgi:hypothetical protein
MLGRPFDSGMFSRGTGPINLSYQVQSFSTSGMKVCYLDYLEPDGSKYVCMTKDGGPGKWLRTVVTSTASTFRT